MVSSRDQKLRLYQGHFLSKNFLSRCVENIFDNLSVQRCKKCQRLLKKHLRKRIHFSVQNNYKSVQI